MSGVMYITENGKSTMKQFIDDDSHSRAPWTGEPLTTDKGTIIINVRDAEGRLVAEVSELNYHALANLALIKAAPELLEVAELLLQAEVGLTDKQWDLVHGAIDKAKGK